MPSPQLFKADDGTIHEVVESRALTLDECDQRIAEIESHLARAKELRDRLAAMQDNGNPAPDAPADQVAAAGQVPTPPPTGTVDLTVTPAAEVQANQDAGQAPVDPATEAPAADNAAQNNGQVDPAAASNPQPGVDVAVPPFVG